MSIPLYLRARELALRPPLKAVLKEMCIIADDDGGSIYPSISTIARYTGLCGRGVRNALDELQALGYISRPGREQRRGGSHAQTVQYRVNAAALPTDEPLQDLQPVTPAPDAPVPLQDMHPTPAPHSMTAAPDAANSPYRPYRPGKDIGARKRATQLPPDFLPNDEHKALATKLGVDLHWEVEQFKDHHCSKGTTFRDWNAGLRTWLRNAKKFQRSGTDGRNRAEQRQASNLEALDTAFPVDR